MPVYKILETRQVDINEATFSVSNLFDRRDELAPPGYERTCFVLEPGSRRGRLPAGEARRAPFFSHRAACVRRLRVTRQTWN